MQLTLYGTGFCAPSPNKPLRSYSGWGIEIGDSYLLFDMGGGVLHKMLSSGMDIFVKPTHIFITHHHIDHNVDLIQFMQGRCVETRNRKLEKVLVNVPPSVQDIMLNVWKLYKEDFKLEDVFSIQSINDGTVIASSDFKVTTSRIKHTADSLAYRLDFSDKSIVYSGDMGYDETICELGRNADIAILECSFPDKKSLIGNHLCPEDIGNLAKIGGFKKVVLTHIGPQCVGREEEMIATIKNIANCEVIVGEDMMRIEV
ncbi:MAG TPA: MBL fold metallo-hydrolase [Patescibacteria group bacterium]|nr:MBL fold metallo-hydrolase [Patescibacteria group bacterium]